MVKMTLKIDGMACGMCESQKFAVKKVSSSHTKGETEIIAETALDEDALRKAIGDTGYTVVAVETAPYEKKGFSLFHH